MARFRDNFIGVDTAAELILEDRGFAHVTAAAVRSMIWFMAEEDWAPRWETSVCFAEPGYHYPSWERPTLRIGLRIIRELSESAGRYAQRAFDLDPKVEAMMPATIVEQLKIEGLRRQREASSDERTKLVAAMKQFIRCGRQLPYSQTDFFPGEDVTFGGVGIRTCIEYKVLRYRIAKKYGMRCVGCGQVHWSRCAGDHPLAEGLHYMSIDAPLSGGRGIQYAMDRHGKNHKLSHDSCGIRRLCDKCAKAVSKQYAKMNCHRSDEMTLTLLAERAITTQRRGRARNAPRKQSIQSMSQESA